MGIMITAAEADEIERAEQKVAQRRAALSRSLNRVEKSGADVLHRWQRELKPTVMVAAAVVGAVAVIGVTIALAQRSRRRPAWLRPQQSSRLAPAAKALGVWALRIAARRATEALVARLPQPASASATSSTSPAAE